MNFWLIILAVFPGLALILFFYFRNRYKKEPSFPIVIAFCLGAIILLPASATANLIQRLTGWFPGEPRIWRIFLGAFFIAGLVEETWKFFVVRFYCYHRPEFDEPYDGIMYSTAVSLGFATLENILYVFGPNILGGLRIGILRAFLAVPSHAFYGVLMGYFLGEAKFAKNRFEENLLGLLGLSLAIAAHGLYDFLVIALPYRPFLLISLIIFALLTWVIFFEATRRHSEMSPHRAPELIQVQKQLQESPKENAQEQKREKSNVGP